MQLNRGCVTYGSCMTKLFDYVKPFLSGAIVRRYLSVIAEKLAMGDIFPLSNDLF